MSAPFPDAGLNPASPARLIVFGAGALGCLLGAQLAAHRPGPRVLLIGRPAAVAALQAQGVRIVTTPAHGPEKLRTIPVAAATALPPLEPGDAICVLVKTGATAQAGESIANALTQIPAATAANITVWTLQNGIDNQTILQAALERILPEQARPPVRVAVASQGATLREPGVVADFGGGYMLPDDPSGRAFGRLLAAAGMVVFFSADIRLDVWRKLAVNCVVNPLTLLLQRRNRFILTPELAALRKAVVAEVVAVAAAEQVRLDVDDVLQRMEAAMAVSCNFSSMYQDWLRYQARRAADGRRAAPLVTEIESLNGAVVARAGRHGISVPANQTLYRLVRFHETIRVD